MSATLEHPMATAATMHPTGRAFRIVRIVLGILLLTAAGLKLYGLNVTALPRAGWFATPRVQLIAAEWELVLGLWLLSGAFQFGAWLAAIGTFATFATVSAYFGWIGIASCGCFGVIRTSPWVAFGVDVAALVVLAIARPTMLKATSRKNLSLIGAPALAFLAFLTLVILQVATGVGDQLFAQIRGDLIVVTPDSLDFGNGAPGQTIVRKVNLTNAGSGPVRIIGGTSDCSCVTTDDLPINVDAGAEAVILVAFTVPNVRTGTLTRTAELWSDDSRQRRIRLHLSCRVVP